MYFISCDFEIIKIYKSIDARLKTKIYVNFTSFIKPLFDSFFLDGLDRRKLKDNLQHAYFDDWNYVLTVHLLKYYFDENDRHLKVMESFHFSMQVKKKFEKIELELTVEQIYIVARFHDSHRLAAVVDDDGDD